MNKIALSTRNDHKDLKQITDVIQTSRYFRKLNSELLLEMLRQGEIFELRPEEYLIEEKRPTLPELFVLIKGSLAVMSQGNFLMRLDRPGDVVGELSVISGDNMSMTDVIAEVDSRIVVFPNHLFQVAENATEVSVIYLIFSHILAEKLKQTTAQSLLRKNSRIHEGTAPIVGILDFDLEYVEKTKKILKDVWRQAEIQIIDSYENFIEHPMDFDLDFLIVDPENLNENASPEVALQAAHDASHLHSAPVLVLSQFCEDEKNREMIVSLGDSDFLNKPFSDFDLKHILSKFRKDHYRQREFEQVEIAADTDRLTGLANRRRMDEFLEALVTMYPEEKNSFSFLIGDVDHFKHYNDTHGHQMGDVVLASVASLYKNRVRRGDLAARFGGEEFVVILPKCDKANALKIGEKLRKAIEDEEIPYQEQQPLGNLTCTMGVATYPEDADTIELLLKKADDCLYIGKESGRNKVVGAKAM